MSVMKELLSTAQQGIAITATEATSASRRARPTATNQWKSA